MVLLANSLYNQQPLPSFPAAIVQITDNSTPTSLNSYKVYRRLPISSYSNGAPVHVYDQTNLINQQQLKRERYRRTMIDRIFLLFDEDGLFLIKFLFTLIFFFFPNLANGQLSKDELYTLSLRLNIFPKLHRFFKQTSSRK